MVRQFFTGIFLLILILTGTYFTASFLGRFFTAITNKNVGQGSWVGSPDAGLIFVGTLLAYPLFLFLFFTASKLAYKYIWAFILVIPLIYFMYRVVGAASLTDSSRLVLGVVLSATTGFLLGHLIRFLWDKWRYKTRR